MNDLLEPLKVEYALKSEKMKLEYRLKNKPKEVNELDYTVIAALSKQVPYKPTKCNITQGRCVCGVGFIDKTTHYCGNCGQQLDWSNEND